MTAPAHDLFSDPSQLEARLSKLQTQLSNLALSMDYANRTKDTVPGSAAALEMFRGQFRELSRAAAALRAEISGSEPPPQLLQAMDQFSDQVIATAKRVGADASALAQGASKLFANLPLIIGGLAVIALVVAALVYLPRRRAA